MMTFDDYIKNNGIKISFLCKKIGVSRDTILRVRRGEGVTREIADKIKQCTIQDIDINIVDGHIRKRAKVNDCLA